MEWLRGHEIGHGSFATISLATPTNSFDDQDLQFPQLLMAVKSSESFCCSSLKNEKRILDLLGDCPQIIRCFGDSTSFENGREFYNLFLEYASGGSLAHQIQSHGGQLPEFLVRRYTRTILEGLRFIHGKGFVHCDVKPQNVLVFDNGDAKIADFGLSKPAGKNRGEEEGENMQSFELRGSPLYMSPESVNYNEYESPSDIWAVGCALVEMVTGKPAWNCRTESNIYTLLLRIGVGDELPEIPRDLSDEGKDFLGKCFVKDPTKRWSAEKLLKHPFVAEIRSSASESISTKAVNELSTSPRCHFDFEEWASVDSEDNDEKEKPETESNPLFDSSSSFSSPTAAAERLLRLVGDRPLDWSISGSWVTVR